VNDAVSWGANTLTLTAADNVNVNAVMSATGSAALTINTATTNGNVNGITGGTLNMGLTSNGFTGRIDYSSNGTLTINGNVFTVLGSSPNMPGLGNIAGNGNYVLGSNIGIDNTYNPTYSFSGTLDGLGHSISGMSISNDPHSANGLIETSTGVIRNLALSGSVAGTSSTPAGTSSTQNVGGLVGANYGAISNVMANVVVSGAGNVGGLVGYNSNVRQNNGGAISAVGTITNAFVTGTVTGSVFTGHYNNKTYQTANAGGLVGKNLGTISSAATKVTVNGVGSVGGLVGSNYGQINAGLAVGNVTGAAYTGSNGTQGNVGGLVGNNGSGTPNGGTPIMSGSIIGGAATGTVIGTNGATAGGLVGQNSGPFNGNTGVPAATIQTSYASGNVSETASINSTNNGIAGSATPVALGGLVGSNAGSITNAYATGNVTANLTQTSSSAAGFVGGLVGVSYGSAAAIANAYATGAVSETVSGGFTGYFYAGGLVGTATAGSTGSTIAQTWSIGKVTGTTGLVTTGALIGGTGAINVSGNTLGGPVAISDSYWDSTTAGNTGVNQTGVGTPSTLSKVSGLTTTQMQTASNFAGFNFTTTPGASGNNWVMVDTDGSLNNAGGVAGGTFPMLATEWSSVIFNAHQLQLMAMAMAPSASYTLAGNIDATNTNTASGLNDIWSTAGGFVPVGYYSATNRVSNTATNFNGVFNGSGFVIKNLTINMPSSNNVGLFGVVSNAATVENVGLTGESITGSMVLGGLVGLNYGMINNDYATGSVLSTLGINYVNTGGLVGSNYGKITNSYAASVVSGNTGSNLGGLVGGNYGPINNSYATGSVSGYAEIGGLAGVNQSIINNSYAAVNVTGGMGGVAHGGVGGGSIIGGLVGMNSGTISNSYAAGGVNGGIGGANYGGVGGLVGYNNGYISTSYAVSTLGGATGSGVGGLVGTNANTINNSYWNNDINATGVGGGTTTGAQGLTTAQMQQVTAANFHGFDFSTPVWGFASGQNSGYPVLCAMTPGCVSLATMVYIDPVSGASVYGSAPSFTYTLVSSGGVGMSLTNATVGGAAVYAGAAGSNLPTNVSDVGTYKFNYLSGLSLTGSGANNYQLMPYTSPATWTVTPLALTGSIAPGSSVYGSSFAPGQVTFTNAVAGNVPTAIVAVNTAGNLSSSGRLKAGNYSGVESVAGLTGGTHTADYTFSGITAGNYTVNPLALNGVIGSVTTTYGTAAPTGAVTFSNAMSGDNVAAVNAATIVNPVNSTGGHLDAGSYTQTVAGGAGGLTGADAGNYTFAGATTPIANYNVGKLALTGSIATGSSVYGATLAPGAVTLSGVLTNDNVTVGTATVNTAGITSTSGNLKAGSYTGIEQVSTLGGTDAANYSFAGVTGNYTVTPAPLTATIASGSNVYGSTVTPGSLLLTGLIGTDQVGGVANIVNPTYSSSKNLDAGTYGQTANAANLSGADAGNYTLATTTSSASYTVSPLALNGVIGSVTTTYGTAAPTGAVTFSNAVSGDNVAAVNAATIVNPVNSTGGHLDAGSYTQTVAGGAGGSLNAYAGYLSTNATAPTVANGTSGASGLTGADAGNYTFAGAITPTANYVVRPAQLSYVAIPTSAFGGLANEKLSGVVSGVMSGDATPYTGTAVWSTSTIGSSLPGAYPIIGSGLSVTDTNYLNTIVQSASNAFALTIKPSSLPLELQNMISSIEAPMPVFFMPSYGLVVMPVNEGGQQAGNASAPVAQQAGAYGENANRVNNAPLSGGAFVMPNIGLPGVLQILNGGIRLPENIISMN